MVQGVFVPPESFREEKTGKSCTFNVINIANIYYMLLMR